MINNNEQLTEELQSLAEFVNAKVQELTGKERGWSLIVFDLHQTKNESLIQYFSNCKREDTAEIMMGMLTEWMVGMPDTSHATKH